MTINDKNRPNRALLLLLLIAGAICAALGQGRWPIPILAWASPVFFIAFVRRAPAWIGLLGFTIAHAAAWEVAYTGMVLMPTLARWGLFVGLSLILCCVLLADRSIARRSSSFWSTLAFPCGWVAFDYANGRFSLSGSWASISYTFTDQLHFAQVASLVGWTGITFLVGWGASVLNWSWDRKRSGLPARHGLVVYAVVLMCVMAFGVVRSWQRIPGNTVRVASIVGPNTFFKNGEFVEDVWKYTRGIPIEDEQRKAVRQHLRDTLQEFISLAEVELRAGARIVTFPEANPSITKYEEEYFVNQASLLAKQHGAYVGLGPFVFRPQAKLPAENKFILIGPDGNKVWDYLKAKRVPGSTHVVGDGTLPVATTDFGRLSCAICFDMDFPLLLKQAGAANIDILLAPSNDWTEVRATHARMAVMRAIEQGFNLIRPTKDGHSFVTDPFGRIVAWQDTDRTGTHVLVADVGISGVATMYNVIGDTFSLICSGVFVAMLLWFAGRRRAKSQAFSAQSSSTHDHAEA